MKKRKVFYALILTIVLSWALAIVKLLLFAPVSYHMAHMIYFDIPQVCKAFVFYLRPY